MTATAELHCHGCGHRLGRRARCTVIGGSCLLCSNCANDIHVHQQIFFGCRERHTPLEHGGAQHITRGRALQLLTTP